MGDRTFASATELSAELRDRRIGCLELLDFYLARAERYNPALNAVVVWGEDPTTIEFARLLAAEIGGFVPPPAYR